MTSPSAPPAPAHWRATFLGKFSPQPTFAPFEDWQFGINFGAPDGSRGVMPTDGLGTYSNVPTADYTEAAEDLRLDFEAFIAAPGLALQNQCWGTEVKLALIGDDGKYLADPWLSAPLASTKRGTGTLLYPPQMAAAISLTTERRGPSGKGRFYVPAPSVACTNGRMSSTARLALAEAGAAFLRNLAQWPGVEPANSAVPVVASSKGYLSTVTGVRVGDRFDVIRSRAGQIAEEYVSVAL